MRIQLTLQSLCLYWQHSIPVICLFSFKPNLWLVKDKTGGALEERDAHLAFTVTLTHSFLFASKLHFQSRLPQSPIHFKAFAGH